MNLDRAAKTLRDAVDGADEVEKLADGTARMRHRPGLLEIVQASVHGASREEALLALGRIQGVADAVAGVKFKE